MFLSIYLGTEPKINIINVKEGHELGWHNHNDPVLLHGLCWHVGKIEWILIGLGWVGE